jgi:opacity protein-like surface antigen
MVITLIVFPQQKVRFSVFVSPAINWLQSDVKQVTNEGPVMGIDAGLTADFFFAERYAFSTGMSIGSFGGNLYYSNPTDFKVHGDVITVPPSTVKYRLQYLSIPIGLKLKTVQIGYMTFFADLGFTIQINVKATGTSNDSQQSLSNDDISDEINTFNLGYHFGLGTEYSLGGNTAVILGLTYTNGFLDITANKSDKITLSGIALRVGLLF